MRSMSRSTCCLNYPLIVCSSLLVVLLLSSLLRVHAQQSPSTDAGTTLLYGTLDADSRHFRFAIRVEPVTDGALQGELLSIDEGGQRFPLENVSLTSDAFTFDLSVTGAKFSSQFDAQQKAYVGRWKQRTADLPLQLNVVKSIPEGEYTAVWDGQLNALIQKLDVRFREHKNGAVYFDSLSQKVGGFVCKKTTDGDTITFDIAGIPGTAKFTGQLSEDGSQLHGKFKQGLIPISLKLKSVELPLAAPAFQPRNRPQTPQPPFPYKSTEVVFSNESAGIKLAGTLTTPHGDGPFPAVILISGSGPQDRNETIVEHQPFMVVADHFSRNGISVLRFDDRGVGKSEGDFVQATSADFATDVASAVAFLRGLATIDGTKIGLCGHSEGGIIAPKVAAQHSDIAFIILMAGPGVNGKEILSSQSRLIMEASNVPAAVVEQQSKIQNTFLDLATQTPALAREQFIEKASKELESLLESTQVEQGLPTVMATAAADQLVSPWFRYFMTFEPEEALSQVSCPVLALNGEKDLQVDPKLNLPAIKAALDKAPTTDVTVRELPNLNHLFQHCETGLVTEYAEIDETFSPEVLDLMTDWILQRTQ